MQDLLPDINPKPPGLDPPEEYEDFEEEDYD